MIPPAVVRFAPSPTGRLHIGGARTALYCYLLARQTGGHFILRIEDTDRKRLVPGATEEIMDGLRWLGLEWDAGPDKGGPHPPYRQSEAKALYQERAQELVAKGVAYPCFCTVERLAAARTRSLERKEQPRYDRLCRVLPAEEAARRVAAGEPHVIRFKSPLEGATVATDALRGEIRVENATLDDFVLVKSDGLALYHLAAMVDDHRMGITHVIRGSEWLSTLPLHSLILRAFGWPEPIWCHLSLFLKPSGKGKMSKRESSDLKLDGHSIFVTDLRDLGYIPEGVLNWIALMGASFDDTEDVFVLADLVKRFDLRHLTPSPAAINFEKADHFNGLHIRRLSVPELASRLCPVFEKAGLRTDPAKMEKVAALVRERMVVLDDAVPMGGFFFQADVSPAPDQLVGKGLTADESLALVEACRLWLESQPGFEVEAAEAAYRKLAEDRGLKPAILFGILRAAVTGQAVSPPLFGSMELIGRDAILRRLSAAEGLLRELRAA